jgi:tripartite-type tricarboxylate transporter receptor subunit TctC
VGYSIFGFTHNETSMKRLFTIAIAALAALPAFAEYPDKPIMIVVPFAAGGPTDKVARDFAEAPSRSAPPRPRARPTTATR